MRSRRAVALTVLALTVPLSFGACSEPADEPAPAETTTVEDFRDTMRTIDMFTRYSDDQLDEVAALTCDALADLIAQGTTNEAATDAVYETFRSAGLDEAEALQATVATIGANCPVDITQ